MPEMKQGSPVCGDEIQYRASLYLHTGLDIGSSKVSN